MCRKHAPFVRTLIRPEQNYENSSSNCRWWPWWRSKRHLIGEQRIQSGDHRKDQFPRFHIGESMTGECGGLVRKLGLETDAATSISVKHGVRVYGQSSETRFGFL